MNTQTKLSYAWLVLATIFAVLGLYELIDGDLGGVLTLAIAGLIGYTSIHNMGGWVAFTYDVKKHIRLLGK